MLKKLFAAAVVALAATGASQAATVYASSVTFADQNGTIVPPARSNTANALGAADGKFYSLGLGGSIILGFSQTVWGAGSVVEITNLPRSRYIESAIFSTSMDGVTWTTLGEYSNKVTTLYAGATKFLFLKLEDTSPIVAGRDGYDIDAIGFTPVPVPAAGLLLAGGLAGLGLMKRRKQA